MRCVFTKSFYVENIDKDNDDYRYVVIPNFNIELFVPGR